MTEQEYKLLRPGAIYLVEKTSPLVLDDAKKFLSEIRIVFKTGEYAKIKVQNSNSGLTNWHYAEEVKTWKLIGEYNTLSGKLETLKELTEKDLAP